MTFLRQQDIVKSSDKFENCLIPLHYDARVVIQRLLLVAYLGFQYGRGEACRWSEAPFQEKIIFPKMISLGVF